MIHHRIHIWGMRQTLFVILVGVLFSQFGYTQVPLPPLTEPCNTFIYKDSKGFIWISSLNGLNRYDGHTVKHYWSDKKDKRALQEGAIQSEFFEDSQSNIWFCTINYLHKYDRGTDGFEHFQIQQDSLIYYRLAGFISDSQLCVQIADDLYSYNINQNKWDLHHPDFKALYFDIKLDEHGALKYIYGTRWLYGPGLLRLNHLDNKPIQVDTLLKSIDVQKIKQFGKHSWLSSKVGLIKLLPDDTYEAIKTPLNTSVTGIEIDNLSKQLVVTSGKKMFHFNIQDHTFHPIAMKKNMNFEIGFPHSKNGLLCGQANEGIFKLSHSIESPWSFMHNDQQPYSFVTQVQNDQNTVFVGSLDGSIKKIKKGKKTTELPKMHNNLRPLVTASHENYFMDESGVYIWSENNSSLNQIMDLNEEGSGGAIIDGHVYIAHSNGLFKINNFEELPVDAVSQEDPTKFYVEKHSLFMYTKSGIMEMTLIDDSLVHVHTYPTKSIITQFQILFDSLLYVATNEGIRVFNINSKKFVEQKYVNIYVESFYIDPSEKTWMGSRNGLYTVSNDGQQRYYNMKSGLPAEIYLSGQVSSTADGWTYWGTNKGVLAFHPDSIQEVSYNPPVFITSLKVHGNEWADDTINVELESGVELLYDENTLTFEITALDYSESSRPQFEVFLYGHDVDTVKIGEQRTITYPNLQPGAYALLYRACTLSGNCKKTFNRFEVLIHPPIWKTWWFKTAMFILGLFLAIFAIRFYIRNRLRDQKFAFEKQELILKNELQLQQERNRIADELHDELGGKLSSIKFAGKKVQRAKSLDEVKNINKRVSDISTELIDSMRSIIWAMDTHNDNLSSLLANIRNYASTLADDNEINLSLDFPQLSENPIVKGQIRHHLYLAIKEVLNNVLKHSSADLIKIKIAYATERLDIFIYENGKGFEPNEVRSAGRGLKNLNKRMTIINGEMHLSNHDGMTTHFSVPVN